MYTLVCSPFRIFASSAALSALAIGVGAAPLAAQPGLAPSLSISRITHNGALKQGAPATFRVTVQNTSQRVPTPSGEPVLVKLVVLDPDQKRVEYDTQTRGIGPRGNGNAAFANVALDKPGTYTVISYAAMPDKPGRKEIRSPDRTQTFNVAAVANNVANAAPPKDAGNGGHEAVTNTAAVGGQFDLNVALTNARGQRANGLRVILKTADGQELGRRNSNGSGEARFPKLAPSPADKPYVIEVRRGARVIATEKYLMPATASTFAIRLQN